MKLPVVAMLVGAVALSACSTSRGRTVELPGGVLPDQTAQQHPPNAIDRMLGIDQRPNVGPCPLMGVLYDNSRLVQFAQPNAQRYANIAFTGEMDGVQGLCRYVDADPITMNMDINMQFGRGPAAAGADHKSYRYWVAVTRRGRAPIAKQYFDVDVRFPRGHDVVAHTEHINRIVIPRANADISGENFEILVGFELTPDQLQFNRDGRRFRIDSATRSSQPPSQSN